MASRVPTVIGQVIEGKIVSVTICHECHDVSDCQQKDIVLYTLIKVSENVESFFDISLPMPEESSLEVSQYNIIIVYSMTVSYM